MESIDIYARANAIENLNRKLRFSLIEKTGPWLNRSTKVQPCMDIAGQTNQGKDSQTELFDSRFSVRCTTLLFSLMKALCGKNTQRRKRTEILEDRARVRLSLGGTLLPTIWIVLRDRKSLYHLDERM